MSLPVEQMLSELQRRLANVVRKGKVHSVQLNPPRCRVEVQPGVVTTWLPWSHGRAANSRDWEPISVGEQVVVLSESGELNNGVVIAGLHTAANPSPSFDPDQHVTEYDDGTRVVYDRKAHALTVTIAQGGTAELNCSVFYVNADIVHNGNQTTSGNIHADGEVSDGVRTMSADRGIYNGHDHPHGDPVTSKVNQKQ